MNRATLHIIAGIIGIVIGGCLVMFTDGIVTPIITLSKVGVVLVAIGGLELLYGLYQAAIKKK